MDEGKLSRSNILVVEDDEITLTLLRRMLQRMKVNRILEAKSGEQALVSLSLAHDPISLVLCDWNLPGMSGIDLFKNIRAANAKLPFLMITARADIESVVAAKEAGVTAYLVKPISPKQLQTKIASLLRTRL